MPYLTDPQRDLLAPPHGAHPERGVIVPTSDQPPFVNAACWGWALTGEYEHAGGQFTANTIYNSPEGAYVFTDGVPSGLNANFFALTDDLFPQTIPYHQVLTADFANALGGNAGAQGRCRAALLKLTATVNGHTVLDDGGSGVYTIAMKTNHWYSWDHWAVGIQSVGGAVTTYQQKVNGTPLSYNCGVVWDPSAWPVTVIKVDGLLQAQIDMLAHVWAAVV